ncbi:MAG: glycosyltransferase family 4 protein [Candidatus Dormibacteraeota bacterium]|nr:glycosyltransferase family 4 protein [Candidatus Dormibacteraeota bacterium]
MKASPRRRLALLHYTAPPQAGGVEAILGAHASLLRRAGHDVRVIAGQGRAELVPEIDSRHPAVERIAHELAEGRPATDQFEALRSRLVARLRPLLEDREVLIAHNILTMPFNLPLAAALEDLGKPVLAWTHDLAWVNPRYAAYRRDGWPWTILCRPQPEATYVAISRTRRREICGVLGLPPRAVPVIPNGVDAEALWGLSSATRRLAFRGGFGGADPLVLVPVRLTRRKRIELALEAAALLAERHPRLRLVVSGPLGPHSADNRAYWDDLRRLRQRLGLDRVVCFLHELGPPKGTHPVNERSVAELYRMADVVLLPSESEGFGLPLLEAALCRTPLVCADLPVLREIPGGAHLFPVDAGPEEVARSLDAALRGRAARAKRGVARRYSWATVAGAIERTLGAALG